VLLEHMPEMDCDGILLLNSTAVEELPLAVVVMDCEQDRQLAAVNGAAQVSGVPALIGHIGIVGGGMFQCSEMCLHNVVLAGLSAFTERKVTTSTTFSNLQRRRPGEETPSWASVPE
jgi:hypothetical protein